MEPTTRRATWFPLARIIVVVLAVVLFVYFLIDDTPAAWLIRAAYAGALVAGLACALYAAAALADRP